MEATSESSVGGASPMDAPGCRVRDCGGDLDLGGEGGDLDLGGEGSDLDLVGAMMWP